MLRPRFRTPSFRKIRPWPVVAAATALLVVVAMLAFGTVTRQGANGPGRARAGRTATGASRRAAVKPGPVPSRNTATSTTRRNRDGSFTTTMYGRPVNYRAADGTWQPIDSKLHPANADGYAWRSGANSFQARFKSTVEGEYSEFKLGDQVFRTSAPEAAASHATVTGSRVFYPGAFPGADLTYTLTPTGVKEFIDLAGPTAATSYTFVISAGPRGSPLVAHRLANGSYRLSVSGSRAAPVTLEAPVVLESAPRGSAPVPAAGAKPTLRVSQRGRDLVVTVGLDAGWLHAPGRHFPVHLDPTVDIFNSQSDASYTASGTTPVTHGNYVNVGGTSTAIWRAALAFDPNNVPADADVTNATLHVYYDGTCVVKNNCASKKQYVMDVHRITSNWDYSTSTSDQIRIDPTPVSSLTLPAASPQGYAMQSDVTSAVQSWLAGTSPADGLAIKLQTEALNSDGPALVSDWYTGNANQPYITATYHEDGGLLAAPGNLYANGAQLTWSPYTGTTSGAPFSQYEVHRSAGSADFTPSAGTLVATIRDQSVTTYRDTTAAANSTFTYKVVTNGVASYPRTVALPATGKAQMTLQPDAAAGQATELWSTDPVDTCEGATGYLHVAPDNFRVYRGLLRFDLRTIPQGATVSSATMSVYQLGDPFGPVTIEAHRVVRDWQESGYSCPGANWLRAQADQPWATPGGDYDATVASSVDVVPGSHNTWRDFPITGMLQQWVNGTQPNDGVLLRATNETLSGIGYVLFASDDVYGSTPGNNQRPKLTVTYSDSSAVRAPVVSVAAPAAGAVVGGSAVTLTAAASDDGRVTQVDFLVDGVKVGGTSAAPWRMTWNSTSVSNGSHALTVRATDDAGNATTSAAVSVTVDNANAPSVTLAAPPATVTGPVTLSATAAAAGTKTIANVVFLVDGVQVGAPVTTSPYSLTWNPQDWLAPAFNGTHQITAAATDSLGQTTTSAAATVTVNSTGTTSYRAGFTLNNPTDTTDDVVPQAMGENTTTSTVQDPYAGTVNADGTSGGSLNRSISGAPVDDAGTPPATCPANAYCPTVNVTNTSGTTWTSSGAQLWYRWYAPNGAIMYEGKSSTGFPATFAANASKAFPLVINPPALPPGVQQGTFRLRIDVWDPATSTWFSAKGNQPIDNPVIVAKALATKLGLERYYQYDGGPVGAGMSTLTNVANGDMLWRWTPFFAPGRGLSTMVDLTYNSLEDHSSSPAGNNVSLSISGLARLGDPIDIHPNKADQISGNANKWVEVVDGDGTTLHFDGTTDANGVTTWTEPPGVNLYLRSLGGTDTTRAWALTRPDKVTYYFDVDGFPTSVEDRNGNRITYSLETTPPAEDPGGPAKRVTKVTDAGGRSFTIDYWSKAEIKKAHVRGKIKDIVDHSGSALKFDYYDDGNLLRLTQVGGVNADGSALADRSFVFTYTTSAGSGPAIATLGSRLNPEPRTPNQSVRLFSIIDPRQHETSFAYYLASDGAQLRWKLKSRTDRDGQSTGYAYDLINRVTSVTAPLSRVTKYTYDTTGKVTQIVNPLGQSTGVQWSADYKVTKVTEPTGKYTSYTYNTNGYPLTKSNELGQTTTLTYTDSAADANDTRKHLSLLATLTTPNGTATTAAGDYQWNYTYDSAGNPDKVTNPEGGVTDYDFSLAGSANPGTLAAVHDANGDLPTTYPAYDPSGQPTQVKDPLGNLTQAGYDVDGNLIWLQDPNHAGNSSGDPRSYRDYFDYDGFGRLGRQSAPKSTSAEPGRLLWSGVSFDANDNAMRSVDAHYGSTSGDPGGGAVTTTQFDVMDRPTLITGPDTSADPAGERTAIGYDAAGRTASVTKPRGVQTTGVVDDFTTTYRYDAVDRVLGQTEYGTDTTAAQTHLIQFCYDLAGDLRSTTAPNAGTSTITCPGTGPYTGAYTSQIDYDAAHRPTAHRDPLGHEQRTSYDANGNITTSESDITTGRVARTESDYDQADRVITIRERFDGATGRNATTHIEYDPNGNRTRVVSPRGSDAGGAAGPYTYYVQVNTYNAVNEPIRTQLPFDARDGTERQYVHRSYDGNGNLLWTSLPVTQSDPAQVGNTAKTTMTYFDPGWVRTSTGPNTPTVHFDYTAQGWQSQRTPEQKNNPGTLDTGKQMTWEYYLDGMLHTRKDQGGQPSSYTFDADNNLVSSQDTGGVTDPSEHEVLTESTFDGFDRVTKTRHQKQGDANWKFTDYGYDADGNVTLRHENGEEDSSGTQAKAPRTFQLSYDGADWLSQQLDLGTDSACQDDTRTVNAWWSTGWEKQRDVYRAAAGCTSDPTTWPKKQTTSWTHYDNGSLRTLTTTNGAGTVTESHQVGYFDENNFYVDGNRTSDHYTLTRGSGSTATTCVSSNPCDAAWTYDARDRLIHEQQRAGKSIDYTLDQPADQFGDTSIRAGNITTENNNGTTTIQRYTGNQLTDLTTGGATAKYWYDDQGNVDCVTLAAGSQANCNTGSTSANLLIDNSYDYLNRLTSETQYAGGTQTDKSSYIYDALDRTTRETEDHTGTGNDRTTAFTYQGLTGLVTQEQQSGGTDPKTKTYSYDSFGHRIAMTDHNNNTGANNTYTYSSDVHGSVSQLIDDAGNVKASYGYTAYGGADATAGDKEALTQGDTNNQAPLNPYRYSGRRADSGTATSATSQPSYDMGARRYGPDTTRFLQQDVLYGALDDLGLSVDPLTQNRYALASGNPISYVEADGHMLVADGGGGGSTSPAPPPPPSTPPSKDRGQPTNNDLLANIRKATNEASAKIRDWLNSDTGKRAQEIAAKAHEEIDGLYGLVEKGKNLNSIAGSWMRNKSLPRIFRQAGSWWLNRVAKDKGFQAAKAAVESPAGRWLKRGIGAVSFALDAADNYAHGDKALPAVGKAGISFGGAVAGAKLGAVAGAALGSEIPIVGNAVGGVIGGVVGGVVGGWLGDKAVEKFSQPIDNALGKAQDWLGDHLGLG